jgi:hypothetical protein
MDDNANQFGMTEADIKAANRSEFFLRVKNFFGNLAPVVIKIFSTIIYYLLRFIKAFVAASVRMLMGKEV